MGKAVGPYRVKTRISEKHLKAVSCGGVSVQYRPYVGTKSFKHNAILYLYQFI